MAVRFLESTVSVSKMDSVQFSILSPYGIRHKSVAKIEYEREYKNGQPQDETIPDR